MKGIRYNVCQDGKVVATVAALERGGALEALYVERGLGSLNDACNLTGSQLCEALGLKGAKGVPVIDEARLLKAVPGKGKTRGLTAIVRHYLGKDVPHRVGWEIEQAVRDGLDRLEKAQQIVAERDYRRVACWTLNDQHAEAKRQFLRAHREREKAEAKARERRSDSIIARFRALGLTYSHEGFSDFTLTNDQIEALLTLAEKGTRA